MAPLPTFCRIGRSIRAAGKRWFDRKLGLTRGVRQVLEGRLRQVGLLKLAAQTTRGMGGEGIGAISRDRVEDGISALGPDERLGIDIVGLNESGNVGLELWDTAMDAALDLLVGEEDTSTRLLRDAA